MAGQKDAYPWCSYVCGSKRGQKVQECGWAWTLRRHWSGSIGKEAGKEFIPDENTGCFNSHFRPSTSLPRSATGDRQPRGRVGTLEFTNVVSKVKVGPGVTTPTDPQMGSRASKAEPVANSQQAANRHPGAMKRGKKSLFPQK